MLKSINALEWVEIKIVKWSWENTIKLFYINLLIKLVITIYKKV